MTLLFSEYFPIFIFLLVSVGLSLVIFGLSVLVANQSADSEKLSAYECGFDPFDDARNRFDVRFYLVAILFIIFDLEASFLFPWAVSLNKISSLGFWSMLDFLFELSIGFLYAWKIGALEWSLFKCSSAIIWMGSVYWLMLKIANLKFAGSNPVPFFIFG